MQETTWREQGRTLGVGWGGSGGDIWIHLRWGRVGGWSGAAVTDVIERSRRRESRRKERKKEKKRGFHLNNLFRGSSCLTPGGFLLSIWTVFCRTPPIHTHTPVRVFKSASRLLLLARGRSTLARVAPSSAAWYAAPLTPLGGSCVWRSLFTSPCAPGDTGE